MFEKLSVLLAAGSIGLIASAGLVQAAPVAFYDFENETGLTITDKAGPPHSNATRSETATALVAFEGSTGLQISSNPGVVDLGLGAEGELNQDFAEGLVFEAIFRPDADKTMYIASKYDTGSYSWGVTIYRSTANANVASRIAFAVAGEPGDNANSLVLGDGLLIEVGEAYAVEAVFDPSKDQDQMSLTLTRLSDGVSVTSTRNTDFTSLNTSTTPTLIGARLNNGNISNAWDGVVDNVRISTVPEPGSIALVGLGGLAMLRKRR